MSIVRAVTVAVVLAGIFIIAGHVDFQDAQRIADRDYGVHLVCAAQGFGQNAAVTRPLAPQLRAALSTRERIDLIDPFKRYLFQCVKES